MTEGDTIRPLHRDDAADAMGYMLDGLRQQISRAFAIPPSFFGARFTLTPSLFLTIPGPDDWSEVRSPSRARRRMKRGHRQNIRATVLPDPNLYRYGDRICGHPETLEKLKAATVACIQP